MDLSLLKTGEKAMVKAINGGGQSLRQKLAAFGVLPNALIEMIRIAPMGEPLQVKLLGGMQFCLGLQEAKCIQLESKCIMGF